MKKSPSPLPQSNLFDDYYYGMVPQDHPLMEIDRLVDMPGPYHLEVSSPGLTRPLRTPADWIRHEGEEVDVDFLSETDAAVRATGVLAGYDAETEILSIRTGEGGMNLVGIPRTRIREVRRTIRFR